VSKFVYYIAALKYVLVKLRQKLVSARTIQTGLNRS